MRSDKRRRHFNSGERISGKKKIGDPRHYKPAIIGHYPAGTIFTADRIYYDKDSPYVTTPAGMRILLDHYDGTQTFVSLPIIITSIEGDHGYGRRAVSEDFNRENIQKRLGEPDRFRRQDIRHEMVGSIYTDVVIGVGKHGSPVVNSPLGPKVVLTEGYGDPHFLI